MKAILMVLKTDCVTFTIEMGASPENKVFKIQHHQDFRTIEVFQKHENSITIIDEGSHCDLIDCVHYYSSWKPLVTISKKNHFKSLSYTEKESNKFVNVNMQDLIAFVKEQCGDTWGTHIKEAKTIYDYPVSVTISKVFFRVVMTDTDGYKTEKIIIFDIPIGC